MKLQMKRRVTVYGIWNREWIAAFVYVTLIKYYYGLGFYGAINPAWTHATLNKANHIGTMAKCVTGWHKTSS